jgi:hypothetical protein
MRDVANAGMNMPPTRPFSATVHIVDHELLDSYESCLGHGEGEGPLGCTVTSFTGELPRSAMRLESANTRCRSIWQDVNTWVALLPLLYISVSGKVDLARFLEAPTDTHFTAEVL